MKPSSCAALTLLASLVLQGPAAEAGTIRHDVSPTIYTTLGALPQFAAVGLLEGSSPDIGGYVCSGTLIAGDWALTAGHCVDSADSLEFTVGGKKYTADTWTAHPGWQPANPLNLFIGNDLGLVHLSGTVGNVTPAERYHGASEVGQVAFYSGFGSTGTGLTGATTLDLDKRVGANVVDGYMLGNAQTARVFLDDFDNPSNPRDSRLGSSQPLSIEYLIGPGDSGGGVFLVVNGRLQLAGVNSFVFGTDLNPDSDYGDIAGATRVTMYNSWIDGILSGAPGAGVTLGVGPAVVPPIRVPLSAVSATVVPLPPASNLLVAACLLLIRRAARRA